MMVYQQFVLAPDAERRMLMAYKSGGKKKMNPLSAADRWLKMAQEIKDKGFHLMINGQDTIMGVPKDVLVGIDSARIAHDPIKDVFNKLTLRSRLPFISGAWYHDL